MRPKGEDVVTWKLRDGEQRALLYDPELTTYSVAAHVVANASGVSQISANLALTSKLADIALNLTDDCFSALRPTKDFGDPSNMRLRGFRRSRNRGYAFCCLAFGIQKHGGAEEVGRLEIEKAMRSAGLPTLEKVYAGARAAISRLPGRLAKEPRLAEIRGKLIEAGRLLHREPDFNAGVSSLCPAGEHPAPLVCDSECETFSPGNSALDMAEIEFMHDCYERYRKVLRSALRAARGLEFEFSDFVY